MRQVCDWKGNINIVLPLILEYVAYKIICVCFMHFGLYTLLIIYCVNLKTFGMLSIDDILIFKTHKDLIRNSLLDNQENVDVAHLVQNTQVVAEALARHIYNLSVGEVFSNNLVSIFFKARII